MAKKDESIDWIKPPKRGKEIRISRVSPMMHKHIGNAAAHMGISVNDFCKIQLLSVLSNIPRHYLEPFEK